MSNIGEEVKSLIGRLVNERWLGGRPGRAVNIVGRWKCPPIYGSLLS